MSGISRSSSSVAVASEPSEWNLSAREIAVWAPTWRMPRAVINLASGAVLEFSMAVIRFLAERSAKRSRLATLAAVSR